MKFYEQAYQMEKTAEEYYRDLATKCSRNEGVKTILNLLSKEHAEHANEIEKMRENLRIDIPETQVFQDVKKIMQELHDKKDTFQCNIEQENLYKEALDLVTRKEKLYLQMIDELESETDKKALKRIAEDERKHRFVLEDMIEMVTRPLTWIENAEFIHFEEY
jgi:rubrerythrin